MEKIRYNIKKNTMYSHIEKYHIKEKSQKRLNKLLKDIVFKRASPYSYLSLKDEKIKNVSQIYSYMEDGAIIAKKHKKNFYHFLKNLDEYQLSFLIEKCHLRITDVFDKDETMLTILKNFHTFDLTVFKEDQQYITNNLSNKQLSSNFKYNLNKYYFSELMDVDNPIINQFLFEKDTGYFLYYFLKYPLEKIEHQDPSIPKELKIFSELKKVYLDKKNNIQNDYPLLQKIKIYTKGNIDWVLECPNQINQIKNVDLIKKHFNAPEIHQDKHFHTIYYFLNYFRYGGVMSQDDFIILQNGFKKLNITDMETPINKFIKKIFSIYEFDSFQNEKYLLQNINIFQSPYLKKIKKIYYRDMIHHPKNLIKNYHMMNAHIDVTERFLKQSIPIFKNIFNLYDTTVLEKTIEHRIVELSLLKDDSNYYFLRAFNKHIHRGELKINHSTCQILHKIALDYQPLNKPLKLSQNLIEILDASYDTLSAHKISSIDLINKNNNINKNHKFKKI